MAAGRGPWLKSSATMNQGIGPGPISKRATKPKVAIMLMYLIHPTVSCKRTKHDQLQIERQIWHNTTASPVSQLSQLHCGIVSSCAFHCTLSSSPSCTRTRQNSRVRQMYSLIGPMLGSAWTRTLITFRAKAMVIKTAHTAMPPKPAKWRVLRPARSTRNS